MVRSVLSSMRQAVLASVPDFDPQRLAAAKADVEDVAAALTQSDNRSIPE